MNSEIPEFQLREIGVFGCVSRFVGATLVVAQGGHKGRPNKPEEK